MWTSDVLLRCDEVDEASTFFPPWGGGAELGGGAEVCGYYCWCGGEPRSEVANEENPKSCELESNKLYNSTVCGLLGLNLQYTPISNQVSCMRKSHSFRVI